MRVPLPRAAAKLGGVAKESLRYSRAVSVQPGAIVATDCRVLVQLLFDAEENDQFPVSVSADALTAELSSACRDLRAPKNRDDAEAEFPASLEVDGTRAKITGRGRDVDIGSVLDVRFPESASPGPKGIFEEHAAEVGESILINPKLLGRVLTVADAAGAKAVEVGIAPRSGSLVLAISGLPGGVTYRSLVMGRERAVDVAGHADPPRVLGHRA